MAQLTVNLEDVKSVKVGLQILTLIADRVVADPPEEEEEEQLIFDEDEDLVEDEDEDEIEIELEDKDEDEEDEEDEEDAYSLFSKEDEDENEDEEEEETLLEQLLGAYKDLQKAQGKDKSSTIMKKLLTGLKVQKISDIPDDKKVPLIAGLKKLAGN